MSIEPSSGSHHDTPASPEAEHDLREQAIKGLRRRLKKRRDFRRHLVVYVVVNTILAAIWAASGGGFFWPAFIIGVWGLGVVLSGWEAYRGGDQLSEGAIECEMERLRR